VLGNEGETWITRLSVYLVVRRFARRPAGQAAQRASRSQSPGPWLYPHHQFAAQLKQGECVGAAKELKNEVDHRQHHNDEPYKVDDVIHFLDLQ
jgi:hypothetical protein